MITHFPAHFIDIMPTLVELTGADYPKQFNGQEIVPMQGISLLPLVKGKKVERDKPLFWQWRRGRAVREGKWKLVAQGHEAEWELYDVMEDPTETNNLADRYPEIVQKMDQQFNDWLEDAKQWN